MVSNEAIIERIMRMGVEHRAGTPVDKLWDLAEKQLSKPKQQYKSKYASFADWFKEQTAQFGIAFAFAYVNSKLEVLRVSSLSNVKFVEWRSNTMPLVELS